jgi:hypothetical protein
LIFGSSASGASAAKTVDANSQQSADRRAAKNFEQVILTDALSRLE